MDKIFIKKVTDYDSRLVYPAVKELMLAGKLNEKLTENSKVLIKPNMLAKRTPEKAVTTHPAVVDAVITVLKEIGVKSENITLADSSGGPQNSAVLQSNYSACGFSRVAKAHSVNLYTKIQSRTLKTDGRAVKEFEVISPALDCDFIINLPKIKTHVMTGMTCRIKNMFGVVPGLKKAEFHMRFPQKENFAAMIVDLSQAVKADFTLVDGIEGMEGDGPAGGNPKKLDLLMAGENPYIIDLAVCKIMGFNPMNPPIMKEVISRGLCPEKLDEDMLSGYVRMCRRREDFVLPRSYSVDFSDHVPRALRWATPAVERFLAPKPKVNRSKCIGCGKCRDICPQHTITIKDGKAKIDYSRCIKCFCCHEMCPVKAMDVKIHSFFNI